MDSAVLFIGKRGLSAEIDIYRIPGVSYGSGSTVQTSAAIRTTTWPALQTSSPASRLQRHLLTSRWLRLIEGGVPGDSGPLSGIVCCGTWYNKGGSLAIPAGRWMVECAEELEVARESAEGAGFLCYPLHRGQFGGEQGGAATKIGIISGFL